MASVILFNDTFLRSSRFPFDTRLRSFLLLLRQ
jgi:hypothetical protein